MSKLNVVQFAGFAGGGGFVLHRIRLEGSRQWISAWYDKDGKLLDCQGYSLYNRKPGKVGNRQRDELLKIGKRYVEHYRKWREENEAGVLAKRSGQIA